MGHHSPGNAAPQDVENAVHYLPLVRGTRVAFLRIRRQQGSKRFHWASVKSEGYVLRLMPQRYPQPRHKTKLS